MNNNWRIQLIYWLWKSISNNYC